MEALILVAGILQALGAAAGDEPVSKTVTEVLREPLPPENLSCTTSETTITIQGPTFRYMVDRATGAISRAMTASDVAGSIKPRAMMAAPSGLPSPPPAHSTGSPVTSERICGETRLAATAPPSTSRSTGMPAWRRKSRCRLSSKANPSSTARAT